MRGIIQILALISIFFLIGCDSSLSELDLSKVDTSKLIECNQPYIRVGTGCCLDKDDNKICDTDETDTNTQSCSDKCTADTCSGNDYISCLKQSDGCKDAVNNGKIIGKCFVECLSDSDCSSDEQCLDYKCNENLLCNDECSTTSCDGLNFIDCVKQSDNCKDKIDSGKVVGKCGVDCKTNSDCSSGKICTAYNCVTEQNPDYIVELRKTSSGMVFFPRELTIKHGETVKWTNVLDYLNKQANVTIYSYISGIFRSPELSYGQSFTYTFNDVGEFEYNAMPYQAMFSRGKIIVKSQSVSADLSQYPSPLFIQNNLFNGLVVIGADADTQDMLGAMDIISSLQDYNNPKIEVGAAVLDTSLASYTNQNIIAVGNPCTNRASAALMGLSYPSCGSNMGVPQNTAIIKLFENGDNVGLVVAGWEEADTQRACRVLAEYEDYALSGKEVIVTGTNMNDITVGVPAVA